MSAHNSSVDHHVFVIGVARQQLENPLKNPALRPAAETDGMFLVRATLELQDGSRHPGFVTQLSRNGILECNSPDLRGQAPLPILGRHVRCSGGGATGVVRCAWERPGRGFSAAVHRRSQSLVRCNSRSSRRLLSGFTRCPSRVLVEAPTTRYSSIRLNSIRSAPEDRARLIVPANGR